MHLINAGFLLLTITSVISSECPARPIITVKGGGRTANCIWEYFAVYFAAKYLPNGQIPYSQKFINTALNPIFDNVSLPIVEDIPKDCNYSTNWYTANVNIAIFQPISEARGNTKNITGNIVLSQCVVLAEPLLQAIEEVKQVLPYKQWLVTYANNKLNKIKQDYFNKTNINNVTLVGMHVRRTDYIQLLRKYKKKVAGSNFYLAAMNYFRNRTDLGRAVFVITTDDVQWTKDKLSAPDVYMAGTGDNKAPGKDLVLLSLCDHTIYDYGTFGAWTAVYTEGEVVTVKQPGTQFDIYLTNNPKWHFVDITKEDIVVT